MKRSRVHSGLFALAAIMGAAPASAGTYAHRQASADIGPQTGVDVYIPNPDPQTPIAWSQGTSPPPPQGDYGGGFIQYLITGNETRPAPRPRVPPPYYPAVVAPVASRPYPASAVGYGAPRAVYGYRPVPVSYATPVAYGTPVATLAATVAEPVQAAIDPVYRRQEVGFAGRQGPGTIVIDTANKFLYLVEGGGRALRYGIGVGRPGFLWAGNKVVTRKAEWPDWTPPVDMIARRPDLPRHMEGGIANPLGARAMYLGSSLYRIHGTNEPNTIGTNVSSGCIRLLNDDVADLYERVRVGTKVVVM